MKNKYKWSREEGKDVDEGSKERREHEQGKNIVKNGEKQGRNEENSE